MGKFSVDPHCEATDAAIRFYESQVRQQVEEGNHGKIVAIDIETGEFELADDTMIATRRLYERLPVAQPWVVRIGYRAVHRFGARIKLSGAQ